MPLACTAARSWARLEDCESKVCLNESFVLTALTRPLQKLWIISAEAFCFLSSSRLARSARARTRKADLSSSWLRLPPIDTTRFEEAPSKLLLNMGRLLIKALLDLWRGCG